jgi:hypothetical protein
MATTRNFLLPFPEGIGPTMSIPYFANGHGEEMELNFSGGFFMTLVNIWHISQRFTNSAESLLIVGQKYPAHMAL